MSARQVVILAGPNGAGKSTMAPRLLRGTLDVVEFVNADMIAGGLSAFDPESAAVQAGRVMLARMRALAARGASFAFETTLSTRSLAHRLSALRRSGYSVRLVFLWLPDADTAVARVLRRQERGGHGVDEDTVRRRYDRGVRNFFSFYRPIADNWRFYDNSGRSGPRLIAAGVNDEDLEVRDRPLWQSITARYAH